jgi:hypothetical protein
MRLVLLMVGLSAIFVPLAATTSGQATPLYAQQTGKPCGFCHARPPELNANGKKFKANGYRL